MRTIFLLGLLAACGPSEEAFVGELTSPVVYGADDRLEVYAHPDDVLREIATDSIVALIPTSRLRRESNGLHTLIAFSLQAGQSLCDDEAFVNQPVAASCSGVLIADDLVLTAGHCIAEQRPCSNFNYVFNYRLDAPNTLAPIGDQDVYTCERVLVDADSSGSDLTPDFALIQLDRPVEGDHTPVTIRPASPLLEGEPISMIGFGSGLPAKIDSGAFVADPRADSLDFFIVNLDAFEGHSGSATFDSEGRLAGILIGGRVPDYVPSDDASCMRASVYEDQDAGEIVHNIASITTALCAEGIFEGDVCETKACEGGSCRQPPATGGGGSSAVPSGSSSGCNTTRAAPSSLATWAVLLLLFAARRFRPRAA